MVPWYRASATDTGSTAPSGTGWPARTPRSPRRHAHLATDSSENSTGHEAHIFEAEGQEVRKLRCIDDSMLNGVNGVSWLSEHPVMPNFEFSALVAAEPSDLLEKQEIEQRNRGANDTETARTRLMGMSQGRAWPVRAPHVRTQPRGTVWHVCTSHIQHSAERGRYVSCTHEHS